MKNINNINDLKRKIALLSFAVFILGSLTFGPILLIQPMEDFGNKASQDNLNGMLDQKDYADGILDIEDIDQDLLSDEAYPDDFDVGSFLSNNDNTYSKEWDPWLTKAAIHAVATSKDIPFLEDGDILALAGGYLYDNEVHIYRWNYVTDQYDHVSEVGDGIFQSDVLSITFADTDYNNLTELICGCADGRVYVFEQRHIFDPVTNTENIFDLVWTSPRFGRIFSVIVGDTDKDYRKDIIVGTGNSVKFYEYSHHGGYPFSEDHWIEYEEVFSFDVPYQVRSLATADVNYNGLPDIAIGLESGKVILLENDGTHLMINGYPYPIAQDNAYREIWDSGNIIHRAITSMSGGNLDDDNTIEIILTAQGQGAYILDTFDNEIGVYRIERHYDNWEADPKGAYPLDYWIDSMVNSSVNLNSTVRNITNVYLLDGSDHYMEPLNESSILTFPLDIYPYNSAMAQESPGYYTYFDGTVDPAWAILDFGNDEEAAGNGIPSLYDLYLEGAVESGSPNVVISVSTETDPDSFVPIDQLVTNYYDVDQALADAGYDYYRYLLINVTGGIYSVDYAETFSINKPIYDALSSTIGTMHYSGEANPTPTAFIGTIDGSVIAVAWQDGKYNVTWDSWRDERWKLKDNVFDLTTVKKTGRFPAWIHTGDSGTWEGGSNIALETGVLPDFGKMTSVSAENFLNWQYERNYEYLISSSNGQIYLYSQDDPYGPLLYDETTSDTLLMYINMATTYLGKQYYTASVIPMTPSNPYLENQYGLYWLFLGVWNGTMGQMEYVNGTIPDVGSIDFYIFNIYITPSGPMFYYSSRDIVAMTLDECLTLSDAEITGQMWGIMRESTWMPKVAGGDFVGGSQNDLVMTNGKVHLLETTHVLNPDDAVSAAPNGELDLILVPDYFKEINENSKGRHYSNANPVNFDGDEDLDLILGFARYDEDNFGFEKLTYGFTYFENEGTAEEPIWVEKKKAVTNNVAESNFGVNRYCDPILLYDNYDFGLGPPPSYGYHPVSRVDQPTRLMMFKGDGYAAFEGNLVQFYAEYSHPTSLLAATYPEAKRIDINMITHPTETNYGFHIFETWDNEDELRGWTLSMTTSDLDEDGKNEVIVGDFNNNIYVFEHLTNNSYKRAFRSFDINRSILTTMSPYAYEQFGGITGEFTRIIYDHVKYLVAGCDLNQNGLQEFIAATDDMIFIFEATLTPSEAYIHDDTYSLVKIIDLQEENKLSYQTYRDKKITAITTAKDLTQNGRYELIVAVTSALLIYEVSPDFTMEEIFYPTEIGPSTLGKFNLPGNYFYHQYAKINTVLVDDFDNDGYQDLALGGIYRDRVPPLREGFVEIVEWQGYTFVHMAGAIEFAETIEYNVINDFEVDDADYDGFKELIIGHGNGIDIYEFTGNNQVESRGIITSNPNYPELQHNYWMPQGGDPIEVEKDVLKLQNGTTIMVYTSGDGLQLARSIDDGMTWYYVGNVFPDIEIMAMFQYSAQPGLGQASNGEIWLVFEIIIKQTVGMTAYYSRYLAAMVEFNIGTMISVQNLGSTVFFQEQTFTFSPSLYKLPYTNSDQIGLTYNFPQFGNHLVKFGYLTGGGNPTYTPTVIYPWTNGTKLADHFTVASLDVTIVDTYTCGITFSGFINQEELSLDLDLFYGIFEYNSSHMYNFERPTRVTSTGMSSLKPSIIREAATENLIITYEEATQRPYGGLWAIWSNDDGFTWQGPYDMMPTTGLNMRTGPLGQTGESQKVLESGQSFYLHYQKYNGDGYWLEESIKNFEVHHPVITAGLDGGFILVYSVQFDLSSGDHRDFIVSANNPMSNFTWYNVENVQDLTIGDSDKDGRHEILAATGKHAVLFEFDKNSESWIHYQQKWISKPYERDVTAVAISDSNGNGLPELLVESDRGIVNSFEVVNKLTPQADILYSHRDNELDYTYDGSVNDIKRIFTLDIDGDGVEDILYSTGKGEIVAVNGSDLTQTLYVTGHAGVTDLTYADIKLLYNQSSNEPLYIVSIYSSFASTFDIKDGTLLKTTDLGPGGLQYSAVHTEDLSGSQLEEIIFGLNNGTVYVCDYELNIHWSASYATTAYPITRLDTGHFSAPNATDIVSLSMTGQVITYLGTNGSHIWNTTTSSISIITFNPSPPPTFILYYNNYWSMATLDVNLDNITDVIAGAGITYALNGSAGNRIWNNTNGQLGSKLTVTNDIDNDGVEDILYGRNGGYWQGTDGGASAISGSTGEFIWNYQSDQSEHPDGKLGTVYMEEELGCYAGVSESGFGYLLDNITGAAFVAFPLDNPGKAIATSSLGFDTPVIIIGDDHGKIYIFSLNRGPTPPVETNPLVIKPSNIDIEWTGEKVSTFLTADANDDGIDEIIEITKYDTFIYYLDGRTETVHIDTTSYGPYSGQAFVADFGNAIQGPAIVAAYDQYTVAFDISKGSVVWSRAFDGDKKWNGGQLLVTDTDKDFVDEVFYVRDEIADTSSQVVRLDVVDGTVANQDSMGGYYNAKINAGFLDNSDKKQIIVLYHDVSTTHETLLVIMNADLSPITSETHDFFMVWPLYAQVGGIAVGDFDAVSGEEFVLYNDWFEYETYRGYDYVTYKSPWYNWYSIFSFDASTITQEQVYLSSYAERIVNHWVMDTDNDGIDEFIAQTRDGHLFGFSGKTYTDIHGTEQLTSLGETQYVGTRLSKPLIVQSRFTTSSTAYIFANYDVLSCATTIDPRDPTEIEWIVPFKGSVIESMVIGDFGADSFFDVLVILEDGKMAIVDSSSLPVSKDFKNPNIVVETIKNSFEVADMLFIIIGLIGLAGMIIQNRKEW